MTSRLKPVSEMGDMVVAACAAAAETIARIKTSDHLPNQVVSIELDVAGLKLQVGQKEGSRAPTVDSWETDCVFMGGGYSNQISRKLVQKSALAICKYS